MWLVLTSVLCDSSILLFTQKISVLASPSADIRMRIGTHVYYVPGMVLWPMRTNDAYNLLVLFCFLDSIWLVL